MSIWRGNGNILDLTCNLLEFSVRLKGTRLPGLTKWRKLVIWWLTHILLFDVRRHYILRYVGSQSSGNPIFPLRLFFFFGWYGKIKISRGKTLRRGIGMGRCFVLFAGLWRRTIYTYSCFVLRLYNSSKNFLIKLVSHINNMIISLIA